MRRGKSETSTQSAYATADDPKSQAFAERTFSITPPVEVIATQLTRAQLPLARFCKRGLGEDLRHGLPLLEDLLEAEEMSVDAEAVGGESGVLEVTGDGGSKEGDSVGVLLHQKREGVSQGFVSRLCTCFSRSRWIKGEDLEG
jgi:hypothetical protein